MSKETKFNAKTEEKKIKKARKKMKKGIEKRIGKTFSIPAIVGMFIIIVLAIFTVHYLTTDIIAIISVYIFFIINIILSFNHIIVRYYKEREKTPPKIFRGIKWTLNKIFPIDYNRVSPGSAMLLTFFYICTLGGVLAIFVYGFRAADSLFYLVPSGFTEYGFFTFIYESLNNSLMPLVFFLIFILAPLIFCFFLIFSALIYKNNDRLSISVIIWILPFLSFIPLFFNMYFNVIYLIIPVIIFSSAWVLTLAIFFRFTKRSAFICLGIMFLQLFASYYIFYADLLSVIGYPLDIMQMFQYPFIIYYLAILFGIPIIIKLFDYGKSGKIKVIGVLISVFLAFILQLVSVFEIVLLFLVYSSPVDINLIQMFGGFGFFYFYLYLILVPLFFIFGYFQIGLSRSIYRYIVKIGKKVNYPRLFSFLAAILSICFLGVLVWFNYYYSTPPSEYQNAIVSLSRLYDGSIIVQLITGELIGTISGSDYLLISTLLVTEGLLAYSSYRSAYNLARFGDILKEDTKNIKIVKLFREPAAYKSRILLGFAIISIFLGTISMYGFLRIHTVLFPESVSAFSSIIFKTIDSLKLIIQFFGFTFGVILFLYYLFKK
ncbi:MAG: hypothetical protein ACTSPY_00315 [Candidatus Helarchaeota archaeon]